MVLMMNIDISCEGHCEKLSHFLDLVGHRPRGYKTFSMLNSPQHEILKAHKHKNIRKFSFFQAQISL